MIKAMIVSVGGTVEPIIKSVCKYKPEFVSFYASQDTILKASDILAVTAEEGVHFEDKKTIVDDPNDLLLCFEMAENAVNHIKEKQYKGDEVIADYTGGTKNMSVALSLAAVRHGFAFSYVGGSARTKDGVGVVIDGTEQIKQSINPWDFLAVEERDKIALLFNQYQFKAAKDLVDSLLAKNITGKSIFKKIGFAIEAYNLWDLFQHNNALDKFKRAQLDELIEEANTAVRDFARETKRLQPFLQTLANDKGKASAGFIHDMYANALRRFYEGKIDDAVLRLYRVVEMSAQERLRNVYNINASDLKAYQVPHDLRNRFVKNHTDTRDGKIKIPLSSSFELLRIMGDERGRIYEKQKDGFLNVQSARNNSYLAHGFDCSKENTFNNLNDFIKKLHLFDKDKPPCFPKLRFR